jgi:predicted dehydrogenase
MRRALLVGAGGMGQGWANNLSKHPEVTLAGWADIREGAAAEAAEKHKLTFDWYGTDIEKAIAECRPDFVVDVTVPEAHHGVTLTALKHGLPVIGEKPMAHSMEAAREMVAASEKAGKLYMVSQSRRYDNRLRAYRRLIEQTCGPVGILNADFYIGAHFGGFRDEMEHVLVLDMAIHSFDQARCLLGDVKPVSVYAEEFNPSWSWYKGAASATCLFEMEGGVRFTYRGSWCAEGLQTSWECDWRAVGGTGTALWDGHGKLTGAKVTGSEGFHHETTPTEEEILDEVAGGIGGSLNDFLNALDTGATPQGECHDNIQSLAMVFGAIESANTGQRVAISL